MLYKEDIDLDTSDIKKMSKEENLHKIWEGRTLMSEVVCTSSLLGDISNVELVVVFGADIILLNFYDTINLGRRYSTRRAYQPVERIKEYTGRMIGANYSVERSCWCMIGQSTKGKVGY